MKHSTFLLVIVAAGCATELQAPVVDQVVPGSGYADEWTPITVRGSGFYLDVRQKLSGGPAIGASGDFQLHFERAGQEPTALEADYLDQTALSSSVPELLPAGYYTVVVVTPAGVEARLDEAYEVLPPRDTDGDGTFNNLDDDDDNDGVLDASDVNPIEPKVCQDIDGDGCDDCAIGVDGLGPLPDALPENDGLDTDGDGACDVGDMDDDNDGIIDMLDPAATDPDSCGDGDADTCDDCTIGTDDFGPSSDSTPLADGLDTDADGLCDAGDPDDDNDGVADGSDPAPLDPGLCGNSDSDSCDDCTVGTDGFGVLSDSLPANDGTDTDGDTACDASDPDDDNDGVDDGSDPAPLNPDLCGNSDSDTCDDCTVGTDGFGVLSDSLPANDGTDTDGDTACDASDPDDDNDGIDDTPDPSPLDPDICGDSDGDTCDDCSVGTDDFGVLSDATPNADGLDGDGDGACAAGDCDDSSGVCSTACPTFYLDSDSDGFGDPGVSATRCVAPMNYVANADDCDDSGPCNAACAPDLIEGPGPANCSDSYDNDCDTLSDLTDPGCSMLDTCTFVTWAKTIDVVGTMYSTPGSAVDEPPVGSTFALGDWGARTPGIFGTFSSDGRTEAIVSVEAVLAYHLSSALGDDELYVTPRFGGAAQGAPQLFDNTELNMAEGTNDTGFVRLDLSAARAWDWADFDGGMLELELTHTAVGGNDGVGLLLDTVGFLVTHSCSAPPEARFTRLPVAGNAGVSVAVDASGSTDDATDPADLEVRWDWDNDESYDTPFTTTKIDSNVFSDPGTHTITVEVRDVETLLGHASQTVILQPAASPIVMVTNAAELETAIDDLDSTAGPDTILLAPGVTATITGTLDIDSDVNIIGDGTFVIDGALLGGGDDCIFVNAGVVAIISGVEIRGCGDDGIHNHAANLIVRDSYIHDNGRDGVQIHGAAGSAIGPNNVISNNLREGVFLAGGGNDATTIVNNTIFGNITGISSDGSETGTTILGNLLYSNTQNIIIGNSSVDGVLQHNTLDASTLSNLEFTNASSTGWTVQNNIFSNSPFYGFDDASLAPMGITLSNNLFYGNDLGPTSSLPLVSSILIDPLFVDPSSGNYALQEFSPAIDAGAAVGVDVNGPTPGLVNGLAPDLGARESP